MFKIILGISLAVNLALIGLIGGSVMRKNKMHSRVSFEGMSYARPYIRALPPQYHHDFMRSFREEKRKPDRGEVRADYNEVLRLLRQQEFNAQSAKTILEKQSEFVVSRIGYAQEGWLKIVGQMDVQTRQEYADTLEEIISRPYKKKKEKSRKP